MMSLKHSLIQSSHSVPGAPTPDTLYQRAVGYEVRTEKVFKDGASIIRVETTEHVPPDVTAQIFWLKNRRRENWRERNEAFTGPVTINLTAEDLAGAGVIIDGEATEVIEANE